MHSCLIRLIFTPVALLLTVLLWLWSLANGDVRRELEQRI